MAVNLNTRHDETVSAVIERLAAAQKSNRGAPGYSRWVNRPVGRVLAAVAFKSGMGPNQVTAASAALSFTAIVLLTLLTPTPWFGVLLAVILAVAYALDSADGQLARLLEGGSPAGEWLDHVVDCTKSSAVHLAVLICWYRFFELPHVALLLLPLAFCLQSAVWFFAIILTEQLRRGAAGGESKSRANPDEPAPWLRSFFLLPADYGVLCLSFILLGAHTWFIGVYAVLAAANVVLLLAALPKWYSSLQPNVEAA